ncbi:hypothetical protein ACWEQ4_01145 [Rhodococcus sp. NPDC003994]
MTAPALVKVQRVMTPKEANPYLGEKVDALKPTVEVETIAYDADTGQPVFAYLDLGADAAQLREAVLGFEYSGTTARAGGFENRSRTFGYAPRRPVYGRESCRPASLVNEAPHGHVVLEQWADKLKARLGTIDERLVTEGSTETEIVNRDWKLGDTHWTSGVINQSSRLPYHRDGFNFHAWSAMPVFRRNMRGGYLAIPEYDTVLGCRDGWAAFFPGWQLVHGVTPMQTTRDGGYRYSVVYYSLKGMKDCFTAAVETQYGVQRRTERERKMAAELKAGEKPLRSVALSKKQSGRLIGGKDAPRFDNEPAQ